MNVPYTLTLRPFLLDVFSVCFFLFAFFYCYISASIGKQICLHVCERSIILASCYCWLWRVLGYLFFIITFIQLRRKQIEPMKMNCCSSFGNIIKLINMSMRDRAKLHRTLEPPESAVNCVLYACLDQNSRDCVRRGKELK